MGRLSIWAQAPKSASRHSPLIVIAWTAARIAGSIAAAGSCAGTTSWGAVLLCGTMVSTRRKSHRQSPPIWASSHVSRLHAKWQRRHTQRGPRYASLVGIREVAGLHGTKYGSASRNAAPAPCTSKARPRARVSRLCRPWPASTSPRSKASAARRRKPFKPRGSICRFRNAGIASPARSCRRRLCSSRIRSRTTRISTTPCAATSVVARPISASAPPSMRPRRRWRAKR